MGEGPGRRGGLCGSMHGTVLSQIQLLPSVFQLPPVGPLQDTTEPVSQHGGTSGKMYLGKSRGKKEKKSTGRDEKSEKQQEH